MQEEDTETDNVQVEVSEDVDEEILEMIKEHNLEGVDELTLEIEKSEAVNSEEYAEFVKSTRGHTILQYNNFQYKKAYKSKHGFRWNCASMKDCPAFVYLNEKDEIISTFQEHDHDPIREIVDDVETVQKETAVVITSRKGKEMLLFRNYTYRKQYDRGNRARWVCSNQKNCKACVFTDSANHIITACLTHCHDPPKYYLKPGHVLGALREPLILETD